MKGHVYAPWAHFRGLFTRDPNYFAHVQTILPMFIEATDGPLKFLTCMPQIVLSFFPVNEN